jgi:two-component system, cell cycle sensor histidine kinase and response regulator CckA
MASNSERDTKNRKCIVRAENIRKPPTREQLVQEIREQKKKVKSLENKVMAFRHTEHALLESDKNLSAILEESADGTVIVNAEGTVLYVNPAAEKLFGRAKKGFVGFPFGFPVSTDKSEDHLVIRNGDRLCEVELHVVQMHWNNRTAFQLSVRDITDRKRAEAALEEALERHQLANRATFDVIWDWNFQTDALLWNPNYQIVFGYQPDEIPPGIESRISRIHPEDRDRVRAGILAAIASGAVFWSGNYRYCRRDGHYADVEDRAHISRDSSGAPVRMVGAMLDITERKRADQELRMLSAAMEQSSALVIITSNLGDIEYVNTRFTVVTGYTLEEVRGKNPRFLKSGDKPAEDYRALWETITSGRDWHGEFQNKRKDGTLYSEQASISPMRNAAGAITNFIAVKEDITANKALQTQLFQAQKMESIGQLAGGVAHDFNNMLQVIGSYAEFAMMKIDSNHALYNYLVQIREATRRSADLTRQLLAFARKQAISPKVLDLNDTVSGMLKIIRRLIGENIELAWMPGADVWLAKIDPSQIDQILANLAVNSRDAISGTGKITIETTNAVFDEAYCALHVGYIPGEYIMLAVSDNGSGMTRETIDHLFEPFFTTKGLGKGTGLGTATVFGIVKQNKGFISVYSEPGVGTTFKVYLPRFSAEGVADRAQKVEAAPPRGCETVLIVEDEAAILDLGRLMLEELGYRVLTAGSPGEAIRLATEDRAEIHLVITDVVMPEMNGRELVERIGKSRPGLKYLFMSGYMANIISKYGVLDEGVRFIQKPFSSNDLARKVREALEQR